MTKNPTTRREHLAWRYLCEAQDWEIWPGARRQLEQESDDNGEQAPDDLA